MKISKRWKETAEVYKHFTKGFSCSLDFSYDSALLMYSYESTGLPVIQYHEVNGNGQYNGFAVGKHIMDITVAMWIEDMRLGILTKHELMSNAIPDKLRKIIQDITI